MLDIRHLKTIKALQDGGSLVEAAERLYQTQSALSHQIKDLEQRIGMSLYIRKSRPLRLTGAGQRLLALSDQVLPMLEQGERDLKQISQGRAGRLFMSIDCHSCFDWLMPSINRFRDLWPEVEVDLSTGFSFAPLPGLQQGELDLVVTSDPVPLDGIEYLPLFRYEVQLALPEGHALLEHTYIHPQHLADQILITYPVERERMDVFTHFLNLAGTEPAQVRKAELTLMIAQLVASGRGVAALPNWAMAEYVEKGFLQSRPLGEQGLWRTLYTAVRTEQLEVAYMIDFLKLAREVSFETLEGIKRASGESGGDR